MSYYTDQVIKSRRKNSKLLKVTEQEINEIYSQASEIIKARVKNSRSSITKEYNAAMQSSLKKYRKELNKYLNKTITSAMKETIDNQLMVQFAFWDTVLYKDNNLLKSKIKSMMANESIKAYEIVRSGAMYKDKKSLSSRLWNLTGDNIKKIDTLIQSNILAGADAKTLAKQLEKFVNDENILHSRTKYIKVLDTKTGLLVKRALPLPDRMPKSISYQSRRLARTSLMHTAHESTIQCAKNNPFTKGVKWNLSATHYDRVKGGCSCEEYAFHDEGLGIGVFPVNRVPVSHPNCVCYFTEEVDVLQAREEIIRWLKGGKSSRMDRLMQQID